MEKLLDYVALRKDLTFAERGFNNVDALVLNQLSYADFQDCNISLKKACKNYIEKYDQENVEFGFSENVPKLIREISTSIRYQNIILKRQQVVFDQEQFIQFGAITFELEDGSLFMAFRGTDSTIVGWKENMKMTYESHLPCQDLAKNYVKEELEMIPEKKYLFGLIKRKVYPTIYVSGHSKGGYLAMYAYLSNKEYWSYITRVYNFDGPGFRDDFYEDIQGADYDKITNYQPAQSIIGRLLSHHEKSVIVQADGVGLTSHDPFEWYMDTNNYVFADASTKESEDTLQFIDDILMSKSDEEKKKCIDLIFSLFDTLEINTISDMSKLGLKQGWVGLKELTHMNSEERKFIFDVVNFIRVQTAPLLKPKK